MSLNSSLSSSNDSILHPHLPSITFFLFGGMECIFTRPGTLIYTAYSIINILLLLPLSIFILHLGLQQWRKQRSTSTARMTSHSDSFTYHMVAMELFGVLGCVLFCCGIQSNLFYVPLVSFWLVSFTWYGQMFFHMLTCVEHYLAVVHPITYLSLRGERGIRRRNVVIGCVWLLCFGTTSLQILDVAFFLDFCLVLFSLTVVCFCSLSVLCVLIGPGPGEGGGDRERGHSSKQRAFYTITAILGVLLLRFICILVWAVHVLLRGSLDCVMMAFEHWFNIPSTLVLPLLFLHRAGMLACCKNNAKRG